MQAPLSQAIYAFTHTYTYMLALSLLLGTLSACSTPPKPPSVDESNRRPANSAMAVELQVCQSELHNTRIEAHEAARLSARTADETRAAAVRMAIQQALAAQSHPTNTSDTRADKKDAATNKVSPAGNAIYSILFAYGSARVSLPTDEASRLIKEALDAPLIMLRGRTDGSADSATESRIARERSAAVQSFMVRAGIDPSRIRATWQAVGDHAADNRTDEGRTLNRRVEIEIYREAPQWMALRKSEPPAD